MTKDEVSTVLLKYKFWNRQVDLLWDDPVTIYSVRGAGIVPTQSSWHACCIETSSR